ncbi:cyclin-dependent kinase-like 4 [Leptopilina boulardi]|uniref:cyclin-dependent kinase-like 4 n=1 Tax=Leptopilina boulardi TaxID=63433 RepID=UPI0021F53BB3|nr:cyclin-dependent kinase-like 4 [Leptopilina boulardi]
MSSRVFSNASFQATKDQLSNNNNYIFKKPQEKQVLHEKINALNVSINIIQEENLEFSNSILGQGAQGVVRKGKYLGSEVAIKSIVTTKNENKNLLREIKILDEIKHPNIITLMAVCPTVTQCHIVIEFFESNLLHEILFDSNIELKLDIASKSSIAFQLCEAVSYLHQQPQRFIVKMCDLGLSKSSLLSETLESTIVGRCAGTLLYMASEILMHSKVANEATDVWSVACTLVELFTAKKVWNVKNAFDITKILLKHDTPNLEGLPIFLRDDLKNCFSYKAEERPMISDLLDLLRLHNEFSLRS